jgi:hypothetical protein
MLLPRPPTNTTCARAHVPPRRIASPPPPDPGRHVAVPEQLRAWHLAFQLRCAMHAVRASSLSAPRLTVARVVAALASRARRLVRVRARHRVVRHAARGGGCGAAQRAVARVLPVRHAHLRAAWRGAEDHGHAGRAAASRHGAAPHVRMERVTRSPSGLTVARDAPSLGAVQCRPLWSSKSLRFSRTCSQHPPRSAPRCACPSCPSGAPTARHACVHGLPCARRDRTLTCACIHSAGRKGGHNEGPPCSTRRAARARAPAAYRRPRRHGIGNAMPAVLFRRAMARPGRGAGTPEIAFFSGVSL